MNRLRYLAGVVLLLAGCGQGGPPKLTRGPFIQLPADDAVTVVWRTSTATDGVVEYGLDPSCRDGAVTNRQRATEQAIALPGLRRGTNYFYRVRSGGVVLSEGHALRTKRAPGQPFQFAVIGDWGAGTEAMRNVAGQINARADLDLLLTVGDNIYPSGQRELYDPYWFRLYGPTLSRAACFPALGNHDYGTDDGAPFVENFHLPRNAPGPDLVERNYSFDYGNAHFVVLDSPRFGREETGIADAIVSWLAADLAATKQPWKFAFFHYPPCTSIGSHSDHWGMKQQVLPVLEAGGVQMVFAGHNHFYERTRPIRGVVHIITGSGGAQLYTIWQRQPDSAVAVDDRHGFTLVEVAGNGLGLRQISDTGEVLDTFTMERPTAPAATGGRAESIGR